VTSNASLEAPLILRSPAWLFGLGGVVLCALIALFFATLASGGFTHFYIEAAMALSVPALIGVVLFAASVQKPLQNAAIHKRAEIVLRGAVAFAIAGLVWPLSFVLAILANGDAEGAWARTPSALMEAVACVVVGGLGGALGAAAASWASLVRR